VLVVKEKSCETTLSVPS